MLVYRLLNSSAFPFSLAALNASALVLAQSSDAEGNNQAAPMDDKIPKETSVPNDVFRDTPLRYTAFTRQADLG